MLKDLGYILQLSVFHTMLLNLVFYTSFFTLRLLSCIILCTGCASNEALNQLHGVRLKKKSTTSIGIQQFVLKFSGDRFFIVSYHFKVLCTGHSTKKAHNRFRYRARLR